MNQLYIFDCDGVLADSLHRYRAIDGRIDLAHWRGNQHHAYMDTPGPFAEFYKRVKGQNGIYTIIATARECHDIDIAWINDFLGMPDYLISRPIGSNISGQVMKINGLRKLLSLRQFRGLNALIVEDNIYYLKGITDAINGFNSINAMGIYCPSNQGH